MRIELKSSDAKVFGKAAIKVLKLAESETQGNPLIQTCKVEGWFG